MIGGYFCVIYNMFIIYMMWDFNIVNNNTK